MILNLNVEYVVKPQQLKDPNGSDSYWAHDRQTTEFLIRTALTAKFPEGCEKSAKKKNAKIQNALGRALIKKQDSIDVERNLVEHVQDALAAWTKCPVEFQHWLVDLEDEVERALKHADEVEASTKNGALKQPETAKA